MIKKFLELIFIFALFSIIFLIAPFEKVLAYTPDYLFHDYSETHSNLDITIDEETQIWTLDGTSTGGSGVFDWDYWEENDLGYVLDEEKDYVVLYEYISGSVTNSASFSFRIVVPNSETLDSYLWIGTSTNTHRHLARTNSFLLNKDNFTNSTNSWMLSSSTTAELNNFKFKLSVFEIDWNRNDIDLGVLAEEGAYVETLSSGDHFFSADDNQFLVHSWFTETTQFHTLSKSTEFEDSKWYLVKYIYVSGTFERLSGTNIPSINVFQKAATPWVKMTANPSNYEINKFAIFKGEELNDATLSVSIAKNSTSIKFDNFRYEILVEEMTYEEPEDVGESTDPPDGIYLAGSHVGFPGTIYFNRAEEHDDSTHQAWFLATGSGSTFDLEALAVEPIYLVFEPDSKILLVGTELTPGDQTYTLRAWYTNTDIILDIWNPSSYDVVRVRAVVDDELQDDENFNVEYFDYILLMTPLFLGDGLPDDVDITMDYEEESWLHIMVDEKVYFTNNETIDIEIIDDNLDFYGTQISSSNEEYSHIVLVINDEEFIFNISGDPVHFEIYQGGENGHVIDVDGVPQLDNEELSSLQIYLTTFEIEVYRVDFFDDEILLDNINVFENDLIPEPENPTKEGFVFHQWETLDDVVWNFDVDVVTEYTTLFAKWIEVGIDEIVVIFNSNGGSSVSFQVITSGEKVTEPTNPTKEDFTFDGWFVNIGLTTPFDFDDEVSLDFTLYAKWIPVEIETPPIDVGSIVTEYGVFIIIGLVIIIALFGFISKRK